MKNKLKELIFKFEDDIFKGVPEGSKLLTFIFDKSLNDWRPIAGGVFAEAAMYGEEISETFSAS